MGAPPEGITLADAAQRLACHVETLRVRVREGRLKARRGPHGRYYVLEEDLARIPPFRRPLVRRQYSQEELEAGWALLEEDLVRRGADRELVQKVLAEANDTRGKLRHSNRMLAARRLQLVGLTTDQVARELGISERHVRRLGDEFATVMGRFYRSAATRILEARERGVR